jgi:hypothetical protein
MEFAEVGFERRHLATVRWTVATAVAFPQKRNPTLSSKRKHPERGVFCYLFTGVRAEVLYSRGDRPLISLKLLEKYT